MARTGKIARLPRSVREQLNARLFNGDPGKALVKWLNSLTEVQSVLRARFEGREINEQNLSEWRQGGYLEWVAQRELLEDVEEMSADAAALDKACGEIPEKLARIVNARYAAALAQWNGKPDHPAAARLRTLGAVCREVTGLRRTDLSAARLRIEEEQFEMTKKESKAILKEAFEEFMQEPENRQRELNRNRATADRIQELRIRVYGERVAGKLWKIGDSDGVDGEGI